MKKIIIATLLLFPSLLMFSQKMTSPKSFKIINESSTKELNYYKSVLSKSNLENFRLKNEDVALEFDNGIKCILFSAQSLNSRGIKVDVLKYNEAFKERYTLPVFKINSEGHLLTEYKKRRK